MNKEDAGVKSGSVSRVGTFLLFSVLAVTMFLFLQTTIPGGADTPFLAFGATASSTVVVGNAGPTVTAVKVNNDIDFSVTASTTTNISVNGTVSDNNGCTDITSGTSTILLYRSGITSSSCLSAATPDPLNCYRSIVFTASSTCSSGTTNTTTTFAVQYFAQATDASSSFASQLWQATIIFKDGNNTTGTADSAGGSGPPDLLTLTAIGITTSSINYGTLSASSTTPIVQTTTVHNAGNATSALTLLAQSTLTKGGDSITTTSQRYGTSTSATFPGSSTALTETAVTVTGFLVTSPTSTTPVTQGVWWGLAVPAGTATGTYNGVNLYSAVFQP